LRFGAADLLVCLARGRLSVVVLRSTSTVIAMKGVCYCASIERTGRRY